MNWTTVKNIFLKELRSFFNSPVAYVVIIVYLIFLGYLFTNDLFLSGQSSLRPVFDVSEILLLFFAPAITMRLISEEKKSGTLELLVTKPVREIEIIVGKFLAAWMLFFFTLLPTLCYLFTVVAIGTVDIGVVIGGYLGLLLIGAVFLAVSLFCSSLTENQIIAVIVSFAIVGLLWILNKILIFFPGPVATVLEYISVDYHFSNIARGVIDSRDVIYYACAIGFSLYMGSVVLGKRRWS
ncbi:MAG TPA: ABC transporter permease [Bacteroidota bacterium]|nr:ABC transporter permease [Bacteroidota bacterium]